MFPLLFCRVLPSPPLTSCQLSCQVGLLLLWPVMLTLSYKPVSVFVFLFLYSKKIVQSSCSAAGKPVFVFHLCQYKQCLLEPLGPWLHQWSTVDQRGWERAGRRRKRQSRANVSTLLHYLPPPFLKPQTFAGFSHVPRGAVWFCLPVPRWNLLLLVVHEKEVLGLRQTAGLVVTRLCQGDGGLGSWGCNFQKAKEKKTF